MSGTISAPMTDASEVVLDVATVQDAGLLGNLLELYTHDLSDVFPRLALGNEPGWNSSRVARVHI